MKTETSKSQERDLSKYLDKKYPNRKKTNVTHGAAAAAEMKSIEAAAAKSGRK